MFRNRKVGRSKNDVTTEDPKTSFYQRASFFVLSALIFLLPLAFFVHPNIPFEFFKTSLLFVLVYSAFLLLAICWVESEFISLSKNRIPLLALLLLLIYIASTLLSSEAEFINAVEPVETAGFIAAGVLLLFTIPSVVKKRNSVLKAVTIFLASVGIVLLVHIAEWAGLGFDLFKDSSLFFNDWIDLSTLSVIAGASSLVLLTHRRFGIPLKLFYVAVFLLAIAGMAVMGHSFAWLFLSVVSLGAISYLLSFPSVFWRRVGARTGKAGFLKKQKKNLPAIFLSVLVLLTVGLLYSPFTSLTQDSAQNFFNLSIERETRPSWSQTIETIENTYRDGVFVEMFLGSGPNTFDNQWQKYISESGSFGESGNDLPSSGLSRIATSFTTVGLLGGVLWLLFFVSLFVSGVKYFLARAKNKRDSLMLRLSLVSFLGALYIWTMSLFYLVSITVMTLGFILTGFYLAFGPLSAQAKNSFSVLRFREHPLLGLGGVSLLFIILALGGVGLFITGKHHLSFYEYTQAKKAYENEKYNSAEKSVDSAIERNNKATYRRLAARVHMKKIEKMGMPEKKEQTLLFQEEWEEAVRDAEISTELDPEDHRNWQILGELYAYAVELEVQGAEEKAREAFSKAQELSAFDRELCLSSAKMEAKLNNYNDAVSELRKILEVDPQDIRVLFLLSDYEIERENIESAKKALKKIIEEEPKNVSARFKLGVMSFRAQEYQEAINKFDEVLELYPKHVSARYLLGLAYAIEGERNKAIGEIEKLVQLKPNNQQVKQVLENLKKGKPALAGVSQGNEKEEAPVTGGHIDTSL